MDDATGAIDHEAMTSWAFDFAASYDPDLDLSFLGWSVGDDYDAALVAAAKEVGAPAPHRTKRDSGSGEAMLVSGKDRDIDEDDNLEVRGTLTLAGVARPLVLRVRRDGERLATRAWPPAATSVSRRTARCSARFA